MFFPSQIENPTLMVDRKHENSLKITFNVISVEEVSLTCNT